jgi:cytochrome c oxidase subunit 2
MMPHLPHVHLRHPLFGLLLLALLALAPHPARAEATSSLVLRVCATGHRGSGPAIGQAMKNIKVIGALLAAAMAPAVHAETPMDYLWTHGPAADPATRLTWGLAAISVAVVVIIAGLVLYACLRRRPLPAEPESDLPGRMPVEPDVGAMSWIYIGVGISTLVLFASTLWTLHALAAVSSPQRAALTIDVVAHQWWWEATYHGANAAQTATAVNEIHIPVGEPVHLKLQSDDVIHSFWIPKLAGKTDMIPGQTNWAWVQAAQPGVYRGQCAEFCGPQHAHMALYIVAEDRARFDAWRAQQLRDSAPPPADAVRLEQGRNVFIAQCGVCHTVRGTAAAGRLGPDLTHLMGRQTIAAGTLPNNTASLSGWVADAQGIKPGSRMPTMKLSPQDLHAVVDYLETLH